MSGSCGSLTYFYVQTDGHCTCAKAVGTFEWVYANSGATLVGQDLGTSTDDIPGLFLFTRVKKYSGSACPNTGTWGLSLKYLDSTAYCSQ